MANHPHEPLPLDSRSLLVLYSSVTGTAEDCAHRVARRGRREGWQVTVKSVQHFNQVELLESALVVFILPTTGNGVAPPSLAPLWTSLLHPALPNDMLEDLRYAVFGLGDSSYSKYNWVGKKMSRRLDALGATTVVERGEGDDQNEWGIESTFPQWMDKFYEAIDPLYPAAPGFRPLSPQDLPAARINLIEIDSDAVETELESIKWAPNARWAKIQRIDRITKSDWFQDVRQVELEIENVAPTEFLYSAGDVLEIRPKNFVTNVENFLNWAGWKEIANKLFQITPNEEQRLPAHLPVPCYTTLRQLLTHELDITSVPRLSFFEWLAHFSHGDLREKLEWFCTGEGQDDLIDYTLRPKRTISEVMFEFRGAKIPPEYIFDLLPPIRARGFSIASSPAAHAAGKVDLLVAIVEYKTILSVPRKGLCTNYIKTLTAGDDLAVRFDRSGSLRLPKSNLPLIMIGPGTGVAPFRALLEERKRVGAKENLLFFGCRSIEQDFYYREEWQNLVDQGFLTLSVAASRDQEDKIYVQHRIPEYADLIWDYLTRGGSIFICGSTTAMPKAVKKSFLAIFSQRGEMDSAAAEKYWDDLERQGRIVEETWG